MYKYETLVTFVIFGIYAIILHFSNNDLKKELDADFRGMNDFYKFIKLHNLFIYQALKITKYFRNVTFSISIICSSVQYFILITQINHLILSKNFMEIISFSCFVISIICEFIIMIHMNILISKWYRHVHLMNNVHKNK